MKLRRRKIDDHLHPGQDDAAWPSPVIGCSADARGRSCCRPTGRPTRERHKRERASHRRNAAVCDAAAKRRRERQALEDRWRHLPPQRRRGRTDRLNGALPFISRLTGQGSLSPLSCTPKGLLVCKPATRREMRFSGRQFPGQRTLCPPTKRWRRRLTRRRHRPIYGV